MEKDRFPKYTKFLKENPKHNIIAGEHLKPEFANKKEESKKVSKEVKNVQKVSKKK